MEIVWDWSLGPWFYVKWVYWGIGMESGGLAGVLWCSKLIQIPYGDAEEV